MKNEFEMQTLEELRCPPPFGRRWTEATFTRATLIVLALVPACGSSSESPAPVDAASAEAASAIDSGGPTKGSGDGPVAACGCDHAASLCEKLDTCAPFLVKVIYGDAASCADRLTKACTEQCKSPGSGMTETSILACEAALSTASCTDVFTNAIAACSFRGTLAHGEVCGDSSQCASGFCSHGGNLCGACAAKGAAGAACPSASNDECQTGLVCSQGKICAPSAVLGGACDDNTQPCPTGMFCTSAKTCAATVATGADCPGSYLNLENGTLCSGKGSASNPQTAKQIGTAPVGAPCGLAPGDNAGPTLCAPGSVGACTLVSGGIALFGIPTKGICAGEIPDDYPCQTDDNCQAGALCISNLCKIPSGRYCE